ASLPLRSRNGAPAPIEAPVAPTASEVDADSVPARAAVFSSFRTRRSIEFMEQAHAAGGAVPAGDVAAEAVAAQEPELVIPEVVLDDDVPGLVESPSAPEYEAWSPTMPAEPFDIAAEEPWAPSEPSAAADEQLPTRAEDGWIASTPTAAETWDAPTAEAWGAPVP